MIKIKNQFNRFTDSPEYELALGALTNPKGSSRTSLFGKKDRGQTGGPIQEDVIVTLLNYLFPDAEKDQSVNHSGVKESQSQKVKLTCDLFIKDFCIYTVQDQIV